MNEISEAEHSADGEPESDASWPQLDAVTCRVLACLVEKQSTTPDQYPLTLNALVNACNQKSSREPVMDLEPGEVGHAINELEQMKLVERAWSSRVERYQHRFGQVYDLLPKSRAVLCSMMLRGPQTAAQIRSNCSRLHDFDDTDDVEYTLTRLAEAQPPLATLVSGSAGQRGAKWMHLLAGEVSMQSDASPTGKKPATQSFGLADRVAELEQKVTDLEQRLAILE